MVKIITCRRTTSRSPSPLPFNSLFFSLFPFFRLLLLLSLSFFNPPILPSSLSLCTVPNPPFLRHGSFPHLGRRRGFANTRFIGGMCFLSW